MDEKENRFTTACCCRHDWNGYTIDELEQRRVINSVKCEFIKEQLTLACRNMTSSFSASGGSDKFSLRLNQVITWGAYGLRLFRSARDMVSLFRNFKTAFVSDAQASGNVAE